MTAVECLAAALAGGDEYQRPESAFLDAFRRATPEERIRLVREPIVACGHLEGLVAAVVSALCRETGTPSPGWTERIGSPTPFFAFPACTYAMRVRLIFEAPPAFRVRNVFVSADYLSRA